MGYHFHHYYCHHDLSNYHCYSYCYCHYYYYYHHYFLYYMLLLLPLHVCMFFFAPPHKNRVRCHSNKSMCNKLDPQEACDVSTLGRVHRHILRVAKAHNAPELFRARDRLL